MWQQRRVHQQSQLLGMYGVLVGVHSELPKDDSFQACCLPLHLSLRSLHDPEILINKTMRGSTVALLLKV